MQAQGCSASGMKSTEGFGSITGGIWRVDCLGQAAVSWQEGAKKDTLHPAAELGWAKTSVMAVPRDSLVPLPQKRVE